MATAGSIMIYMGANTLGLKKGIASVKAFEKSIGVASTSITARMAAISASITAAGATMIKFAALPAALMTGVGTNMFANYEYSLSKVVGLVGVAQKSVNAWSEELLKMSTVVGRTPQELAEALYFVTSAGVRGKEAMEVLEYSAKAAAVGMGTTKDVADLVTSAMNAYGKENLTAANAVDVVTMAVREGKAEADKLVQSMGIVLPVAAEMGVTFSQVGAAMAAMTRTGTKASTAGMQLRQIMQKILKPAKQSETAIADLGMSFEDLLKTVESKGLLQALLDIKEGTEGYSKSMIGKIIPNIRAYTSYADIMGKNLKNNIVIFNNLENAAGTLDKAFENVQLTLKHKLNITNAAFNATLIKLGETLKVTLMPILADIIRWLDKAFKWLESLDEAQVKALGTTIKWAIMLPLTTLAIGGMVRMVGKAISVFKLFAKGVRLVQTNLLAMNMMEAFLGVDIIAGAAAAALTALGIAVGIAAVAFIGYKLNQEAVKIANEDMTLSLEAQKKAVDELEASYDALDKTLLAGSNAINKGGSSTDPKYVAEFFGGEGSLFPTMNDKGFDEFGIGLMEDSLEDLSRVYKLINDERKTYFSLGSGKLLEKESVAYKEANASFDKAIGLVKEMIGARQDLNAEEEKGLDVAKRSSTLKTLEKELSFIKEYAKYNSEFSIPTEQLKAYEKALKDLVQVGGAATSTLKGIGESIKTLSLNMDLEKTASAFLESFEKSLIEPLGRFAERMKEVQEMSKDMDFAFDMFPEEELNKSHEAAAAFLNIQDALTKRLDENTLAQSRMKGAIDLTSDSIQSYKDAILEIALIQEPLTEMQQEQLDALITKYKELQMETFNWTVLLNQVGSVFTTLGDIIGGTFGEALSDVAKYIRFLTQIIGVIQTIGSIFNLLSAATKANAVATVAANTAMGASNVALSATNASTAISGAVSSGASMPFPYNLAAMATGVGGVMAGLGTIPAAMALTSVAMLADGGIIPAGHPNDSFPAMLSSNEAVIPLNKYPDLMRGSGNMEAEVVLKGEDFYVMLREVERKRNNSF